MMFQIFAYLNLLFGAVVSVDEQARNAFVQDLEQVEGKKAFQKGSDVLLVVTTANVIHRTQSLLFSLSTIDDEFDLLVVDELSTDGTSTYLIRHNINYISPKNPNGVTHNWNLAYDYFIKNEQYNVLFISNNDVLIPNGAIDKLSKSLKNCDCDLIVPLSTGHGKGHRFAEEGIESRFKAQKFADFIGKDINYQIVQNYLNEYEKNVDQDFCEFNSGMRTFHGFFFGMRRSIRKVEFNESTIFNPRNRNIHQEFDLTDRMNENQMKICLNKVSFVYHYKASTITKHVRDRQTFVRGM
eukprot:TRINITY_DN5136_c2_g4_i2.p1 TRINITY_DN5136_c2_g4~~TRINITY_DN5136_c2_g4_i2.p1  ORF type:complete len:297 (-),score=26.79 TRINITY_DN5136_c2_g4_i2:832-1722(-)